MAKFTKTHGIQRYVATGTGRFPLDMLRYDSAWPATEHDANILDTHLTCGGTVPFEGVQLKRAQIDAHSMPAIDRWRSYGWHVALLNL
jgi:hypothetical protein